MTANNTDDQLESHDYIVASSKSWHRAGFEKLVKHAKGDWHWVSMPEELQKKIEYCDPRYIFFLHWSWPVPESIWSRYECVCFHMTDVPYGRGGSPLQNLIMRGHKDTYLSALKMVEELDAGPVYTKEYMSLEGRAQDVYIRAGELSYKVIRWMVQEEPEPSPQQGEVTVFNRRQPHESEIPPNLDSEQLYDFIRMLDADGYPHAFIIFGSYKLEFRRASLEHDRLDANVTIRKHSIESEDSKHR